MTAPHHLALSIPEEALREFVLRQRWFGAKSRESEISHVTVIGAPVVRDDEPLLAFTLVEVRFHAGTHELYNLPVGFRRAWDGDAIAEVEGWIAYDALADDELAAELERRVEVLLNEGFCATREDADAYVADLRAMHHDSRRRDLAWRHGLDSEVLDPMRRTREIRNFVEMRVKPVASEREGGQGLRP